MELRLLANRQVDGHVVDGPAVELVGLVPGRDAACLPGSGHRRSERLRPEAGTLVVARGMDDIGALEGHPEFRGLGVEPPQL